MSARCTHWIGAEARYCGATGGVRQYLNSTVCPLHTPSALAGKPEPAPGPVRPAVRLPATVRTGPADRRPLTVVPDPT